MYLGRIVERAPANELFRRPAHPYTIALLSAVPVPDPRVRVQRVILEGDVPSPLAPPSGCAFHPRCPLAEAVCRIERPALAGVAPDHEASCHRIAAAFELAGSLLATAR